MTKELDGNSWEIIMDTARALQPERAPISQGQAGDLARRLLENGFNDELVGQILDESRDE
ncbi:hypothetical protein [Glutamicibacter sp. NPDC087583]|uniref:hypothetical protein n=1 Tax=Glutamicibacter sp. NPDC087583 TaxID=3363995 RepID=UPI003808B0CC